MHGSYSKDIKRSIHKSMKDKGYKYEGGVVDSSSINKASAKNHKARI